MSGEPREINWDNLDKTKFYSLGVGVFSGVTTCLYPLTVIKTRNIAGPAHLTGLNGVQHTVAEVWRDHGLRGFYRGFGTVCVGAIPARVVYMSVLELVKSGLQGNLQKLGISDAAANGSLNFVAGASASLASQAVYVPVDVVSQRLMVLNKGNAQHGKMQGLNMAKQIVQQEGMRGLWKGLFASIGTYVPSSAIWWGSYGFLQKMMWKQLDWIRDRHAGETAHLGWRFQADSEPLRVRHPTVPTMETQTRALTPNNVVAVQTASALLSGLTSAFFTTPLDVVKTRMQLTVAGKGKGRTTSLKICRQIWREQGLNGFLRGFLPRAANVALWGTAMVSAYEFLKRMAAIPKEGEVK